MQRLKKLQIISFLIIFTWAFTCQAIAALNVEKLSDGDIQAVKGVLKKLVPLIQERDRNKNLATLAFDELYAPLDKEQKTFLKQFEHLDAKKLNVKIPFRGIATGKEELTMVTGQKVKVRDHKKEGTDKDIRELSPQFVPPHVYKKYKEMMAAMKKDIGKTLLIESGYRSSAYQLYLFVFYLSNHDYSIRETSKFVALPGYSEHGSVKHQALDFINPGGINGEDNPEEFETLPENKWLLKNAGRFGFVLSYPKKAGAGITWEPWHWRYDETK